MCDVSSSFSFSLLEAFSTAQKSLGLAYVGFLCNKVYPQVISLFSIAKIWPTSSSMKGKRNHLVFLPQDFFLFSSSHSMTFCYRLDAVHIPSALQNGLRSILCTRQFTVNFLSFSPPALQLSLAAQMQTMSTTTASLTRAAGPCTGRWGGILFVGHPVGKANTPGCWYGRYHLLTCTVTK